ncbi:hypothetical protein ABDB91_17975 [Desulfoscipio sp. XC116]|uniref:hypothetical protein n=1 Tax=Desulfoscipio sp. XC116 TaxID=3144975 RepID=UPI00325AB98F
MVNDIKGSLPEGVVEPYFNDCFDDVFGCIYAITGDGYTYEEKISSTKRLVFNVYFRPMAVAIIGVCLVLQCLTLLVLPTMYAAWSLPATVLDAIW